MSGSCSSISSQTLGAGIGGVVVGLLIGAVISCVTTKIVWGAPNMKRCQKRSEQSKLRFAKNQLMTIHVCLTHVQESSIIEEFDYNILSIPRNALEYLIYYTNKYNTCTHTHSYMYISVSTILLYIYPLLNC